MPKPLIEHAGLAGNCVVVGAGEYLEIWDADAWAKQEEELDAAAPEIAEGLAAAGNRVTHETQCRHESPSPTDPRSSPVATLMAREHEPVLAPELVSLLAPAAGPDRRRLHLRRRRPRPPASPSSLGPEGMLIGIDRDPAAAGAFRPLRGRGSLPHPLRLRRLRVQDFLPCSGEGIRPDMIYMDLGMSSMQVDAWERGFSYSYDAPLDMRMDTRQGFDAADLVNEWPEARIAQVLRRFGEERYAGGIAREIVRRRPLSTTSELVAAIKAGMPTAARFGGGHPAKRSFQAIRIAVNGELDALERGAAAGLGDARRWAAASPRSPSTRSRTGR